MGYKHLFFVFSNYTLLLSTEIPTLRPKLCTVTRVGDRFLLVQWRLKLFALFVFRV